MKIFGWGTSPDYAIQVNQGSKGRWRWAIVHKGETVALSPVRGWETAEAAKAAAESFLGGIHAHHLKMDEEAAPAA